MPGTTFVRHLSYLEGKIHVFHCSSQKPSIRTLKWSSILLKDKDEKQEKREIKGSPDIKVGNINAGPDLKAPRLFTIDAINKDKEKNQKTSDKTAKVTQEQKAENKTPILKVIAPNIKETGSGSLKASDIKVNLENVKEQSLEKPVSITAEPISKLKEKLLDLKSKEIDQQGNQNFACCLFLK